MSDILVLPALYLPPISYFHILFRNEKNIEIEQFENYPKQTYRNRTKIATANGPLELFIPIKHGLRTNRAIKETEINYDHDWQRLHWLSIQTAYRSSPYFEYYEDEFAGFFTQKYPLLIDFNVQLIERILKILKINRKISFTKSYEVSCASSMDFRELIHPKKETVYKEQIKYNQTFLDKVGFISDLSIIDLIFNQGPQSKNFL